MNLHFVHSGIAKKMLGLAVVMAVLLTPLAAAAQPTQPEAGLSGSKGVENYSPAANNIDEPTCTNLGRAWLTGEQAGCSRQRCAVNGASITGDFNTEGCILRGTEYGANLESRLCKRLGRQWLPVVNRCLQNVNRGQSKVIDNAPQCKGSTSSYIAIPANRGYDICVTKSTADSYVKTAAAQRTTVSAIAFNRSKVLCDTVANFDWKNGACRQLQGNQQKNKLHKSAFMIGDSVTWRANDEITARNPSWEVDGQPGTAISTINKRYRNYVGTHDVPRVFVIALGTNDQSNAVNKDDFVRAANLVPRSTTVVFVAPYRDGKIYGQPAARNMNERTRWMQEIARTRPRTCVAPWKAAVENNPKLVIDGVHETPQSEGTFANIVTRAVKSCR